ncbi:MAG: bifunctional demethylmenaquinone methyltransferase/2-methoxy-6-polyprenyl-1,4-benzoquinol methylase UbiE [Bacteroidales bacterium]|jgi:demethylmenaquinone methyltransferase/2-methoxy-6-polyprenyl-1,4-benzoquinol methylase
MQNTNIKDLFNKIAFKYDKVNHVTSLNIDKIWRKKALKNTINENDSVLDIACGTADSCIEAIKQGANNVIGLDISEQMLKIAENKINKDDKYKKQIQLVLSESDILPFENNFFDVVSIFFGIRNIPEYDQILTEVYRVLKNNGKLIILELSMPTIFPINYLYNFYFKNILPIIGGSISGQKKAYQYLYKSVKNFPDQNTFNDILKRNNFKNVNCKKYSLGIATCFKAIK